MRVLFFGTYDTETTPRVQVLIEGLRANGITVVECNVPLKVSTAERVAMLKQPWRLPLLGWRIVSCWWRLVRKARALPNVDAVIIGHLGQFDIHLAKYVFRGTPLILDCMVTMSGAAIDRRLQGRGGLKMRLVRWLDSAAFKIADLVIVDTQEHQQTLPSAVRPQSVVVLVGAPDSWFAASTSAHQPIDRKDARQPLKVLFFGNYIPLQGVPVIGRAIARLQVPMEIIMVGSGQERVETERLVAAGKTASVTWLSWVAGDELPALVAAQDVCLGIFGTTAKARRVVPNKVYQGAAAGCAIITSDTEPQRRTLGTAALFVPPGDDAALAAVLERLARDRSELRRMQHVAHDLAQKTFTPEIVVLPLLEKLTSEILPGSGTKQRR